MSLDGSWICLPAASSGPSHVTPLRHLNSSQRAAVCLGFLWNCLRAKWLGCFDTFWISMDLDGFGMFNTWENVSKSMEIPICWSTMSEQDLPEVDLIWRCTLSRKHNYQQPQNHQKVSTYWSQHKVIYIFDYFITRPWIVLDIFIVNKSFFRRSDFFTRPWMVKGTHQEMCVALHLHGDSRATRNRQDTRNLGSRDFRDVECGWDDVSIDVHFGSCSSFVCICLMIWLVWWLSLVLLHGRMLDPFKHLEYDFSFKKWSCFPCCHMLPINFKVYPKNWFLSCG